MDDYFFNEIKSHPEFYFPGGTRSCASVPPCASTQAATHCGLPYVALPRQAKFWASTSKAMRRSFGAGRAASIHATAATMSFAAGARTTTW